MAENNSLLHPLRMISPVAWGCYKSFRTLCPMINRKGSVAEPLAGKEVLNLTVEEINIIRELSDRYEQWVGNLGALQEPDYHLSLDHRLKDAKVLQETIFGILNTMLKVLNNVIAIADGSRPNRSQPGAQVSTISGSVNQVSQAEEDSDYDISSSDSDSSVISESTSRSTQGDSRTELQELLSTIKSELNTLFKVAIFIRKSSGNKMRDRAAKTDIFDNRADIMYIRDRFNHLREGNLESMRLAERLGEANARRRQYFKYRRDHNDRLSHIPAIYELRHGLDQPVSEDAVLEPQNTPQDLEDITSISQPPPTARTVPTMLAETEVTALVDAAPQMLPVTWQEETMSVVSFATSIGDSFDNEDVFPQIPEEGSRGDPFLCPYCCTVQKLSSERWKSELEWRKHVLRDLRPYVCTFSSCDLETYQSQQTWFEHELLNHRCQWICELCSATHYTAPGFKEHASVCHLAPGDGSRLNSARISAITERSRRPVESIDPNECPFCPDASWAFPDSQFNPDNEILVVTIKQFQKHLGEHLQRLALFSLPKSLDDQSNTGVAASGGILQSQNLEGIDNEPLAWGKLDRGRGWAIVAKKRALFTALSVFFGRHQRLNLMDADSVSHAMSDKVPVHQHGHKVTPSDRDAISQSSPSSDQDPGSQQIDLGLSLGHDHNTSYGPFVQALVLASDSLCAFALVTEWLRNVKIGNYYEDHEEHAKVRARLITELQYMSTSFRIMMKDLLLSQVIDKIKGIRLDQEMFLEGWIYIDEWAKQVSDEHISSLEAKFRALTDLDRDRAGRLMALLLKVSDILKKILVEHNELLKEDHNTPNAIIKEWRSTLRSSSRDSFFSGEKLPAFIAAELNGKLSVYLITIKECNEEIRQICNAIESKAFRKYRQLSMEYRFKIYQGVIRGRRQIIQSIYYAAQCRRQFDENPEHYHDVFMRSQATSDDAFKILLLAGIREKTADQYLHGACYTLLFTTDTVGGQGSPLEDTCKAPSPITELILCTKFITATGSATSSEIQTAPSSRAVISGNASSGVKLASTLSNSREVGTNFSSDSKPMLEPDSSDPNQKSYLGRTTTTTHHPLRASNQLEAATHNDSPLAQKQRANQPRVHGQRTLVVAPKIDLCAIFRSHDGRTDTHKGVILRQINEDSEFELEHDHNFLNFGFIPFRAADNNQETQMQLKSVRYSKLEANPNKPGVTILVPFSELLESSGLKRLPKFPSRQCRIMMATNVAIAFFEMHTSPWISRKNWSVADVFFRTRTPGTQSRQRSTECVGIWETSAYFRTTLEVAEKHARAHIASIKDDTDSMNNNLLTLAVILLELLLNERVLLFSSTSFELEHNCTEIRNCCIRRLDDLEGVWDSNASLSVQACLDGMDVISEPSDPGSEPEFTEGRRFDHGFLRKVVIPLVGNLKKELS